jgi:outer membrane protein insertion porin family
MMKTLHRGLALLAVFIFAAALSARAQTPPTIAKIEIKHVGPANVSDDMIRANIREKVGDPYVRTSADDDVKNLYATGLFYNIQVVSEPAGDGVTLTYIVQGKPRLVGIKFEGNKKYADTKLLKKVASKTGEPLDEQKLFNDAQEIKKLYQNAGYPQTEVKYVVSIDENAGTGSATFQVEESPKVKIASIQFVGAVAFPESKLRSLVKIHKPGLFSAMFGWRTFKQDKLIEGKEKLYDFYREKGYIDFEIKDVQLTYPTPKTVAIVITIFEGKPYKVGAVTFTGNKLFAAADLARGLKMRVGDTYTPKGLSDDVDAVEDFYGSKGYIDVDQTTGNLKVNRVPNTDTGTMDIDFTIEEGQKSYVEKIEVRGNTKTKDSVIRRELAVTPGEVFDMTRVKLSKTRLEGLQYFEKVDTDTEPTDVPTRKNLVVNVDEKSTGNVSVGAGFSSVDSVVGFVELTQGNFDLMNPPTFTGGGQKFRIRVQLGTQRQDYELSFVEPWFLGKKLALGVDMYHRELDFVSPNSLYNETLTGGKVSLTRALGSDFLIGSVYATPELIGFGSVATNAPAQILTNTGSKFLAHFGASIAYDTRNSTMLPNHGQRTELDGEITAADAQYYKVELKTAWYFKGPFEGHVLEVVARGGVADGLGGGQVPFYEGYNLGGMYDLRGYDYHTVGPQLPFNNWTNGIVTNAPVPPSTTPTYTTNYAVASVSHEPIGGDTYWFSSAEYSLPLIDRLRFAMFYDIGMVYPGAFSISPATGTGTYNDDVGIGLRLNLPIGPLRLDYGIPMTHGLYDGSSGKFQFGVGYTREF